MEDKQQKPEDERKSKSRKAYTILQHYNLWRRGYTDSNPFTPEEIGKAIDTACGDILDGYVAHRMDKLNLETITALEARLKELEEENRKLKEDLEDARQGNKRKKKKANNFLLRGIPVSYQVQSIGMNWVVSIVFSSSDGSRRVQLCATLSHILYMPSDIIILKSRLQSAIDRGKAVTVSKEALAMCHIQQSGIEDIVLRSDNITCKELK